MRKVIINIGILLLASLLLQAYAQAQPDEKLFQEAKILIFDKEWKDAQEKLEELLEKYPGSAWYSQAVFYRAKCLEERKGKELEALIEKRLSSSNRVVRYFAAIRLSQVEEKKVASRAVPVLKEIIKKEKDDELRDRAKIALLRVDPGVLKDLEEERSVRGARLLKIRVWKDGELTLKINIPWALADLALRSIEEEEKAALKKEGYDLDTITKTLIEAGEIIHIENKEEGTIIKIWIE